jgi:SAM-dependent methyltransferase
VQKKDYFEAEVAAGYDGGPMFSAEVLDPTVDFLVSLAGDGAALEFGVGTGRVAVPLSQRGVRVHGIDLSEAMVAKLREKPGAEPIATTIGDFATTRVGESFSLVYLVFNTIGNLTTQDDQVACFQNAADHLEPGGCFVIEVGIPQLRRLPPGETVRPFDVSVDHLGFDEYDIANQGLISHHFWPDQGGAWRGSSIPFRYVWPAELDLMARLAGLRLRERWNDWDRSPFSSESHKHVSVWERAGAVSTPASERVPRASPGL